MKRKIQTLLEYTNAQSMSWEKHDNYKFNGDFDEFYKLLDIINKSKYKKNINDISYSEKIISFEEDTDISFIPKNFLKNLEKYED